MDAEKILEGTVEELKEKLVGFEGDVEELIEAEKEGDNRKTAIEFLESFKDVRDEREGPEEDDSDQEVEEELDEGSEQVEEELDEGSEQDVSDFVVTGLEGLDQLFTNGVPRGSSVLVSGGSGSGKTIMCLQMAAYHASQGSNVFFMSFEESRERLIDHMEDFGWEPGSAIDSGNLVIEKFSPFDIRRKVEAAMAKEKGDLMIDVDPVIFPEDFEPDFVFVDSLTAVASSFNLEEESYRIYVDQLFSFFEQEGITSFLISETSQEPEVYSPTGVEEFLADGVIVLYNFRRQDSRESAVEILKMRGESHRKGLVALRIGDTGIEVFPDQEVFSAMD